MTDATIIEVVTILADGTFWLGMWYAIGRACG